MNIPEMMLLAMSGLEDSLTQGTGKIKIKMSRLNVLL